MDVGYTLTSAKLDVTRQPLRIDPDPSRVIARPFICGDAARLSGIIERVLALSDAEAEIALAQVLADYRLRHKDLRGILRQNFATALAIRGGPLEVTEERRLLLGAYFTQEYSLQSAALFNPSMVMHPDQSGAPPGATRFVMSLRACGEGHISSIEFRTGTVDRRHVVALDPPTRFAVAARPMNDALYDKESYSLKLREMKAHGATAEPILARLEAEFTMDDLKAAIASSRPKGGPPTLFDETADNLLWLAHSNYHLDFSPETVLSERVIFPVSPNESRGIEDARFVRFIHPDGRVVHYATYSAYNGFRVLPQLIETTDFRFFKINTLNGRCVQNKGMALFPRKLGDDFVMAARLDGENIFLLRSSNIHFWNESTLIKRPKRRWEFIQLGNCGSPIETNEGWLLLTHGVGPMRQYSISALLLDLEDPSRIRGELTEPLLSPTAEDRDGYVPNVVYSCGAMRHEDHLVIPFAVSDSHTTFATVSIPDLLAELTRSH
ncbi:MAG TPA: glycoside hydrolase family 130 protein, partial [Labilithrix sp.]